MIVIQDNIIKEINILSIKNNYFYINDLSICEIYDNIEIIGFDKYYDIEMDKVYLFQWVKDDNIDKIKLIINKAI